VEQYSNQTVQSDYQQWFAERINFRMLGTLTLFFGMGLTAAYFMGFSRN
jgi:hypothetical protein